MEIKKLLFDELARLEDNYNKPITIGEGLNLHFRNEVIKPVTYYINSRYLNGNEDEFGELPFMNIVNANADVSKVATDFDTKDIQIEADDGQFYDISRVFNKEIYNWMKVTNFAKTLNDMNSVRVDYGVALVKRTETIIDGKKELKIEVPEWENLEVDASNILERPIIESHYLTPAELADKLEVWDNVREVLKEFKQQKEDDQILVKEINGKFSQAIYKESKGEDVAEEDEFIFGRYRFYVACINEKKIYLYCDEQKENPYKILNWKARAKRPAVGVIEEGIPAQVWTNDVVQKEHKWFELASKAVLQSASRSLKGKNVLSDIENGTILEHEDGKPITAVNLVSSAVPEYQNLIEKWGSQYEKITATYDAVRGETPPSGQAFRLQALIQQQGASTFDQRKEEMGILLVEIFNDWVLPYHAKRINKAHILSSSYSAEELRVLDQNYANYNANEWVKNKILNEGQIVSVDELEQVKQAHIDFIAQTNNKRFLDVPDNYYKDFKPKVTIITTGEQRNKMAVLETVSNLLNLYMSNPQAVQSDPIASQLFAYIIEKSGAGVSPVTLGLGQINSQAQQQPQLGQAQQTQQNPQQVKLQTNERQTAQ